ALIGSYCPVPVEAPHMQWWVDRLLLNEACQHTHVGRLFLMQHYVKPKCASENTHNPISSEAEDLLKSGSAGSFLVRVSERIFAYVLSYRT
uniref:SH2 domain-containing protein n=1 Tax=Astyanax mexicanus TaxID=7994 RepID=A0A3B1J539_ASTMX